MPLYMDQVVKPKLLTFGDPGTPRDHLLACPACFHVGKPEASRGKRHKCAGCGAILRTTDRDMVRP